MLRPKILLLLLSASALLLLTACERIECRWDSDCPDYTICVGSSVCPPDVTCVWEGEPGICIAPFEEPALCGLTGGLWDPGSCGHYTCGEFPDCDAVIPGCDCGPDANYIEGEGCVEDESCSDLCTGDDDCPEDSVCMPGFACKHMGICSSDYRGCRPLDVIRCGRTHGRWDEGSCGHYECGDRPLCRALIPGCDCGPGGRFVEGRGCVWDATCGDKCGPVFPCYSAQPGTTKDCQEVCEPVPCVGDVCADVEPQCNHQCVER